MATDTRPNFVFLGSRKSLFKDPIPPCISVCHDRAEVETAIREVSRSVTWISFNRTFTEILLQKLVQARTNLNDSHLITLMPPRPESISALLGLFHPVFGLVDGFQWLPQTEMVEVLTRDDARDRLIGGSVDLKARSLTLVRGDITAVVVPFSLFDRSGDGTVADFQRPAFTDHGRTLALGSYEASADAILYELDPDYRRRLNKQRRQSERSFGASLMRLRKQKRLRRGDFAPISSKEIARLERNEVATPHAKTLDIIARRLDVRPEAIKSY